MQRESEKSPISKYKRPVIKRPATSTGPTIRASAQNINNSPVSQTIIVRSQPDIEYTSMKNDAECISMAEEIQNNGDLSAYENEKLSNLVIYFKEVQADDIASGDYLKAKRTDEMLETVKRCIEERKSEQRPVSNDPPEDIDGRIEETEQQWLDELKNFDTITDEKTAEIKERHEHDIEQFEEKWRSDMPRKYRKASQKLLEMKKVENSLANSGNFEQANRIRAECEALELQEREGAQRELFHDYDIARQQLLEKHSHELGYHLRVRQNKRDSMRTKHEDRLQELNNRKSLLRQKYKENSAPQKPRSGIVERSVAPSMMASIKARSQPKHVLLGELVPPNDPQRRSQMKKQNQERRKKQNELQKKNAETQLQKYNFSATAVPVSDPYLEITNPEPDMYRSSEDDKTTGNLPQFPIETLVNE